MSNPGEDVLAWYHLNKRDLPWRKTHDPYAVLVSEIMLQQTTVETVLRYYAAFMARFPNVVALAQADEEAVLGCWQGLGYYRRALNLHRTARILADEYGGRFPQTYDEVSRLPGIGPYIAGAVMSIAFGQPYPAVDGNVLRVISRLYGIADDVTKPPVKNKITSRVKEMMPPRWAGDFTQSLMELGALVCRPGTPDCTVCPWGGYCVAKNKDIAALLPVKKAPKKPRQVALWATVVMAPGHVLLEYRDSETLLGRMWGVPVFEKQDGVFLDAMVRELLDIDTGRGQMIGRVTHVFTHQRWEMDVVCYAMDKLCGTRLRWMAWDRLGDVPIPAAFMKVLDAAREFLSESNPGVIG